MYKVPIEILIPLQRVCDDMFLEVTAENPVYVQLFLSPIILENTSDPSSLSSMSCCSMAHMVC